MAIVEEDVVSLRGYEILRDFNSFITVRACPRWRETLYGDVMVFLVAGEAITHDMRGYVIMHNAGYVMICPLSSMGQIFI